MRIPSENLYSYNINKQIECYFQDFGFHVRLVDMPTGSEEKDLGFDSLFKHSDRLKYFAIQYKRPKITKSDYSYKISNKNNQHEILSKNSKWMFYGFPTFTSSELFSVALHHFYMLNAWNVGLFYTELNPQKLMDGIKTGSSWSVSLKKVTGKLSWGEFVQKFLTCNLGVKESKEIIKQKIRENQKKIQLDNISYYLVDLDSKIVCIVTIPGSKPRKKSIKNETHTR